MSEQHSTDDKQQQLEALRRQVSVLESELAGAPQSSQWQNDRFYSAYYATTGFMLGGIAAMASLLFNVIGSTLVGKHPLEIIRVYLTFPLGEQARQLAGGGDQIYVLDSGIILALGCCLYVGTGMVLGVVFHWTICRFALQSSVATRVAWGTVLAVVVWVVNFYLILSWLQPLLFGGNWITDNATLPWWVALSTHLVFGWTMALLARMGSYTPYRRPTEVQAAA